MEGVTVRLAEFACRLGYDQVSEAALNKIKHCVLDSVGCALYGSTAPWSDIVNRFIVGQGGVREASLWTTDFMGPAANVVLGNGTMIHSYDFDDYHANKIHPGAVVIPSAFAMCEKERLDGKRFVTAVAAGYETMIRISDGINPSASRRRGWHLTGTCGTFGAAAAVGNIWQFDTKTMASALGMAGTQSAGLWAFTADGSVSKRFHPGRSAQSGIIAAFLARDGYHGPTKILEAEDGGFFEATSSDYNLSRVTEALGEKLLTEEVVIKPYPACASLHSSVDAVLTAREEHRIHWKDIRCIYVYNSDLVNVQCGFDYRATGVLEAQMSMKYCLARAVIDGVLSLAQFTREKITDPVAIDLAKRVHFVLDEEIDEIYPRKWPSIVEIVLENGKTYKTRVDSPRGTLENPMSWKDVEDKFKALATPAIGTENADLIIHMVEDVENVTNASEILNLMKKHEF